LKKQVSCQKTAFIFQNSPTKKAVLINALRNYYRLKDLLEKLHIAKSSYCYQSKATLRPDKYEGVRKEITDIFFGELPGIWIQKDT